MTETHEMTCSRGPISKLWIGAALPTVLAFTLLAAGCSWELDRPLTCGDGNRADEEACDGAALGGQTCKGQKYDGGDLACTASCKLDTSGCYSCGDKVKHKQEACDGAALGGKGCKDVKVGGVTYSGGTLGCKKDCSGFDTSGCYRCGDGVKNGDEICDGASLNGKKCGDLGFDGGALKCKADCSWFDTAGCHRCGDGKKYSTETCDGTALDGKTCAGQGYEGGALKCTKQCTLDESACYRCGDNKKTGTDKCDGADLGGETCLNQGYKGGALKCKSDCSGLDKSGCYWCGDKVINGADLCDGTALAGKKCTDLGWEGGTLKCMADCSWFDETGCYRCGDKVKNGAEACDTGDFAGATCVTKGFVQGTLKCKGDCTLNASGCSPYQWVWAREAGGALGDVASQVDLDSSGNILLGGTVAMNLVPTQNKANFGSVVLNPTGRYDVFVAKLDKNGTFGWALAAYGPPGMANKNSVTGMKVDSKGNTLLGGVFRQYLNFGGTKIQTNGSLDIWLAKASANGTWEWALSAGGTFSDGLTDMVMDSADNVYITGSFSGTINLAGTQLTGTGGGGILLAKLNSSGKVVWAKVLGSGGFDKKGEALTLDPAGNLYVAGSFQGSLLLGNTTLKNTMASGSREVFIARVDSSSGSVLWAQQAAVGGATKASDIKVDAAGNIWLLGEVGGNSVTFGSTTFTPSTKYGSTSLTPFLAKMDSKGVWSWAIPVQSKYKCDPRSVVVDASGNAFFSASFYSLATLGGTKLQGLNQDMVLARVDPSGKVAWTLVAGGSGTDSPMDLYLDGKKHLLVAGECSGNTLFGSTYLVTRKTILPDICLAKLKVEP